MYVIISIALVKYKSDDPRHHQWLLEAFGCCCYPGPTCFSSTKRLQGADAVHAPTVPTVLCPGIPPTLWFLASGVVISVYLLAL